MSKKLYPTDALEQARDILAAWEQIDPGLNLGPLTIEGVSAEIEAIRLIKTKIIHLEVALLDLRNQRDAACVNIWDKTKRMRSGIKSIYGDDSVQYQIAGGTRRSERKKPRRNPPRAPLAEPAEGSK